MCKRFEDFEAESKQYNQIILNYQNEGQVFVDPNFHPHKNISETKLIFDESNTEWKRIDEIYQAPLFKRDLISMNFVEQGELENFSFLSALSFLSTQPVKVPFLFDHRADLYLGKEDDSINLKCGAVVIFFNAFGRRVPVLIDTLIPFSKTTQKARFSRPISDSKSAWFVLVEKAYAKLIGSYSKVVDATFSEAVYSLFGFYSTTKTLSSLKSEVKIAVMSPFDRIQKYLNQRAVIGAKIEMLDGSSEKDLDEKGLVANQTYIILSAKKVDDLCLICLRNPTCTKTWNGDWCDGSELWTFDMKREVGFENVDNRTFWMRDSDFLKYFTEIDVLKPIPNRMFLRQLCYQLLPSFSDGFDIESEEANLSERPNFAFKITEHFETSKICRFHIFVERRQTDVNNEKNRFCVFLVSNSGKKIMASELPFCRKYQQSTSSNLISFPYIVNGEDEIQTMVIYRLDKSDLIEDCYVKIFCEHDFKLYNIEEPEKSISEDRITFSNNIKFDNLLFSRKNEDNLIEEEEEDVDEKENIKNSNDIIIEEEEEVDSINEDDQFDLFKNDLDKMDQFDEIKKDSIFKENEINENQNGEFNTNDEFNLLKNKNELNEKIVNNNDNFLFFQNQINEFENIQDSLNINSKRLNNENNKFIDKPNNNEFIINENDKKNQTIILNDQNILNLNNSNKPMQIGMNYNLQPNNEDEKNQKMNSIPPRKMLKRGTSSNININTFREGMINSNNDDTKTPQINLMKKPRMFEDETPNIESNTYMKEENIHSSNEDKRIPQINQIKQTNMYKEETPNIIEANAPNKEEIPEVKSIQPRKSFKEETSNNIKINIPKKEITFSNEENELIPKINSIKQSRKFEKETPNINEANDYKKEDNIQSYNENKKTQKTNSNPTENLKETDNNLNEENELDQIEQTPSSPHRHSKRSEKYKSYSQRKNSKEPLQSPSIKFQQRKLAHQRMNETFLNKMTRKPSPTHRKQESVIKSQKSDTLLNEDITKRSPIRNSGEKRHERTSDLSQDYQRSTPTKSIKKSKNSTSPRTTFNNKDIHKMFNSITDNAFISHFTDNK